MYVENYIQNIVHMDSEFATVEVLTHPLHETSLFSIIYSLLDE